MTKLSVISAVLALAIPIASAAENPARDHWYIQGEGGISFPASTEVTSLYDPGYNGEVQAGYFLTKEFALGLEGGFDFFPLDKQQAINSLEQQYGITGVTGSTNAGLTHFSIDLMGRYYPPLPSVLKVYLFLGIGAAFDSLAGNFNLSWQGTSYTGSFVPQNWTNLEMVPGLGVDLPLSNSMDFFAEGRAVVDFVPTGGPNPESYGTPIVGIPLQAGVLYHFP